ncbi:MAG: hypothetical protein LBV36_02125 [Chromatiales bacterium]|jgi:hypothetical protein|nr:hypothetical protein [Chromatiales bacterium]
MHAFQSGFRAIVLAVLTSGASAAYGMQFDAGAAGGLEYTNNARLTSENEREDLIETALFQLSAARNEGALRANAQTSLLYRNYENDSYDSQRQFAFIGAAEWLIRPDSFVWSASDSYARQPINALVPGTPTNLQGVNVFSTGLGASLPINVRQRLSFKPQYNNFYFEKTDYDNQQYTLGAAWTYRVTLPLSLSLNSNLNRTTYNESVYQGTTMARYFVGLQGLSPRMSFIANLGFTDVLSEHVGSGGGYLANLSWNYRSSQHSQMSAYLASEITNTSQVLAQVGVDPNLGIGVDQQISSNLFRSETARLAYNWRLVETDWRLTGYWDKRHQGVGGTQSTTGTQLSVNYPLGAALSTLLATIYEQVRVSGSVSGYESYTFQGGLTYALSGKLKATLAVADSHRSSDLASAQYDDLRVLLFFSYGSGAALIPGSSMPGLMTP